MNESNSPSVRKAVKKTVQKTIQPSAPLSLDQEAEAAAKLIARNERLKETLAKKPWLKKEMLLGVEHPDFLYAPSKNPYFEKIKDLGRGAWTHEQTEAHQGKWRSLFEDTSQFRQEDRRLHLEIGCNGGHVMNAIAQDNPEDAFIGLDWKFKQIYLAWEKAQKHEIKNTLYLRAHAMRLHHIFGPEELASIRIYFPDPWETKSTQKNRFLREEWFRKAHQVLAPGGWIHIKTDHSDYFDWIEEHAKKTSDVLEIEALTRDLHAGKALEAKDLEFPNVTLFERLFIKDGIPIKGLVLRKKAN